MILMSLCDHNCVKLQTNEQGAYYIKKMLDLLCEESISGSRSGREVVYRLGEKSTTSV